MALYYDDLIDFIESSGISRPEAEFSARRCAMSMAKAGIFGYGASIPIAYFMKMSPGTVLVGGALGAAWALAKSPSCQEVRDAISYWKTAQL